MIKLPRQVQTLNMETALALVKYRLLRFESSFVVIQNNFKANLLIYANSGLLCLGKHKFGKNKKFAFFFHEMLIIFSDTLHYKLFLFFKWRSQHPIGSQCNGLYFITWFFHFILEHESKKREGNISFFMRYYCSIMYTHIHVVDTDTNLCICAF